METENEDVVESLDKSDSSNCIDRVTTVEVVTGNKSWTEQKVTGDGRHTHTDPKQLTLLTCVADVHSPRPVESGSSMSITDPNSTY